MALSALADGQTHRGFGSGACLGQGLRERRSGGGAIITCALEATRAQNTRRQRLPGECEGGERCAAYRTNRIQLDRLAHRQAVECDQRQDDDFSFCLPAFESVRC